MEKLSAPSPRPSANIKRSEDNDVTEYLLLVVLIMLVLGVVIIVVMHRTVP